MRLLLDTHVALWALTDHPALSKEARNLIANDHNTLFVSVASLWEVAIKHEKQPEQIMSAHEFERGCALAGYELLTIEPRDVAQRASLALLSWGIHSDPFDHILIAQMVERQLHFLTHDETIDRYRAQSAYQMTKAHNSNIPIEAFNRIVLV